MKSLLLFAYNNLFLTCLFFSSGTCFRDRESYPTIQDVVSFKTPQQTTQETEGSELTIDIEKLDIHRIKQDDTAFRNQLTRGQGDLFLQDEEMPIDTRRVQKFTNLETYVQAYKIQFRTKMADVMLQLVYMARSKIQSFERQGFINKESSEYRVGLVVRKMDTYHYKARRYLTIMVSKQNEGKWNTESTSILNLHHKIVMMHQDFMHLFYVQMRLHERITVIEGKPIHSYTETYPTSTSDK
ncbi:uncharacterized protein LOC125241975 [Leguminivora glycinivorella]|uniref:uncharacterized protein LOC125241975 n=1 Tax=Leguminivora glycinivorella TaxID=1035111 RepID=UPI00200BCCBE|nr:uncharacterized protein LOC125241975 [Leguminivora glycinivorella]